MLYEVITDPFCGTGTTLLEAEFMGIHRITSYNVCYTKLLRSRCGNFMMFCFNFYSKMIVKVITDIFSAIPPFNRLLKKRTSGMSLITTPNRITSYNVCYTKLLRSRCEFRNCCSSVTMILQFCQNSVLMI